MTFNNIDLTVPLAEARAAEEASRTTAAALGLSAVLVHEEPMRRLLRMSGGNLWPWPMRCPCPICGTKHTHCTDPAMLKGKPSHRVAHCPDPESRPRRYRETGRHPWGYSLYLKPQK